MKRGGLWASPSRRSTVGSEVLCRWRLFVVCGARGAVLQSRFGGGGVVSVEKWQWSVWQGPFGCSKPPPLLLALVKCIAFGLVCACSSCFNQCRPRQTVNKLVQ
eukprot:1157955-Pelagomonas_calceolata.AAC.6